MADFAGLTNIESIWEIFATPLISIFIIAAFTYFLFGKQYFSGIFQKYKFIKVDGKYYKQKHFSGNKHVFYRNKKEYTLLVPVSKIEEKIINIIQKPVVSISILLLFVYSVFKLNRFLGTYYPLKYAFSGSAMLLYAVPKGIIAEIWVYFPKYTLETLYDKISILGEECSYAKHVDYTITHVLGNTLKCCSLLCIINMFIRKNKIKEYLKPIFLFIICIISIVVVYYVEFSQNVKVLEQKAYYAEKQLVLENPEKISEYQEFQIAIGRVENELLYVEDKVFYNAFSIKLEW